ncbi:MAG: hypothetical protein Q8N89_00055 [Azonexus sp.]|nr:hypothetical protein [Azonexus sp.]
MNFAYSLPNEISAQFRWVCWDAEALLYDIETGDTHRVLSPAGHIIELLSTDLGGTTVSDHQIVDLMVKRNFTPPHDTQASLSALCSVGLLKQTPLADC